MQKQPTNTKAKCYSKLKGRTCVVSKHCPFQPSTYLCGCSGDKVRVVESTVVRKVIRGDKKMLKLEHEKFSKRAL